MRHYGNLCRMCKLLVEGSEGQREVPPPPLESELLGSTSRGTGGTEGSRGPSLREGYLDRLLDSWSTCTKAPRRAAARAGRGLRRPGLHRQVGRGKVVRMGRGSCWGDTGGAATVAAGEPVPASCTGHASQGVSGDKEVRECGIY